MEHVKPLFDFFSAIEQDRRIRITHIGIYAALLQYWKKQGFTQPMLAYSSDIMKIAKISSPTTYHRCIKDLSTFGYVRYEPSYNRTSASKYYFLDG